VKTKEEWRQLCQAAAQLTDLGKIAETIRHLPPYRACQQILVSPAPALSQVRINALLDGKELVIPGPGLKEGFYHLRPYAVPFTKLAFAVSLKGLTHHGQLLTHRELADLSIGLLVTEALAVDRRGLCLGDGNGFFDLSCATLNQAGALSASPIIWAVSPPPLSEDLPNDPWDVPVDGVIGPLGGTFFPPRETLPKLLWQHLAEQRIKKMTPLWKEWGKGHPNR